MLPEAPEAKVRPYAWYVLGLLCLGYVLNFVDRQILSILAPDLKRDLAIADSDFGFLYGTAFGVFYSLFGIPLGNLVDRWQRIRLLVIGMALWSVMTALSGLSQNFTQLALARVGVGVGEAVAGPCAYSLIGDYFHPRRRATALGVYSAGMYIGGGISLFIGSGISVWWNLRYAAAPAPLGLVGWQAAFMLVGVPGLLLAAWISTVREPLRGQFEQAPAPAASQGAGAGLRSDLCDILPPLTLYGAARRGMGALAGNIAMAMGIAIAVWILTRLMGDPAQWVAVGLGLYAACSWALAARQRDPAAIAELTRTRSFTCVSLAYGMVAFIGYANTAFSPLYAVEGLGAAKQQSALIMGGLAAVGGISGVLAGGMLFDRLSLGIAHHQRIALIIAAASCNALCHAALYLTASLPAFYVLTGFNWLFNSATFVCCAGTITGLVPARVRGLATAVFLLATNLIGLALGPYAAGKLSTFSGHLGTGLLGVLAVFPFCLGLLFIAYREQRQRSQDLAAS